MGTRFYGRHKGASIRQIDGLRGFCVWTDKQGIVANGLPTVWMAKKWIDNNSRRIIL